MINNTSDIEIDFIVTDIKGQSKKAVFENLLRLERSADFKADDGNKVDIVCLVLSPREAGAFRLIRVSRLQRLLADTSLCNAIRNAKDEDAIHNIIFNPEGWLMAA